MQGLGLGERLLFLYTIADQTNPTLPQLQMVASSYFAQLNPSMASLRCLFIGHGSARSCLHPAQAATYFLL